jgi:5-methylcytosine-specific restriction enzyme A
VICYRMACTPRNVFATTKPPSPWDERLFCCLDMTKIRFIQPRLGTVRPALSVPTAPEQERERDRRRGRDDPCRALYNTARWQQLRLQIFRRDLYTCQRTECGRIESDTSLLVCDHVEPHAGDVVKFWAGPFQTLCKRCHDREKQRLEYQDRRSARHS